MENCTKRFSVILDSRGVTSVRRNHQKYKTRMEQPQRSVWRHLCEILAPNIGNWSFSQRDPPAISVVSLLPYFVSQGSMNSLQFSNNCLCYFTEWYFTTKTRNNNITFPCALCCVWQESLDCFSDCQCSHRHFKLRYTPWINWTVDTPL